MKETILNIAAVVATLAAVAAAAVRLREPHRTPVLAEEQQPKTISDWQQYTTEGARFGPPNPVVTVVEFLDFQCPFCRTAASTLRELRRLHPRDVAVVYRHFPQQDVSLDAAVAAECGNRSGAFQQIHDHFFEQPDSLGVKPWTRFAWEAAIQDTVRFAACLKDSTARFVVRRDFQAAQELDVFGTPTLLVNDQLFTGSPSLKYLDHHVKKVKKAMNE
ncbi:MAG: DsbA family protein [Gemmatimonadota bacterium]